jgi:CARDB
MLRRALALAGGLILVILVVLGIKGCLDARANRELSDYARDVTQIVQETQQTSKSFFGKLEDPGNLTVTDFVNEVNAERSAMDTYAARIDDLEAPGDMEHAHRNLELVYELRSSAMDEIADRMPTALGREGADRAMAGIARQMQKLLAADVLYETVVRPEVDGVLADNGVSGSDLPKGAFLPEGTEWLEEDTVSSALGAVSGATGSAGPGIHGLGLVAVSVNGSELVEGTTTSVAAEEAVEVEVQVQNQGESTENGVSVSVSVDGGNTLNGEVDELPVGEIGTVTIPLTPTPSGEVTLEVQAEPVPGEKVADNNEASYSVLIE